MFLFEYQDLLDSRKPHCPCCDTDLTGNLIDHYDHQWGWPVTGYDEKQWLSVNCHKCGYDVSLNKVGLYRPSELNDSRPYTRQDAIERVLMARTSSLVEEQLTIEYLTTLRNEVSKWLEYIDEAIYRYDMSYDEIDEANESGNKYEL